jgi:hypothetical protein
MKLADVLSSLGDDDKMRLLDVATCDALMYQERCAGDGTYSMLRHFGLVSITVVPGDSPRTQRIVATGKGRATAKHLI